jgi:hypothetical protein
MSELIDAASNDGLGFKSAEVYVNYGDTIVEYAAASTGNYVPAKTIIPPAGETKSSTLRVDASGKLFVLWLAVDTLTPNIAVYTKTATGLATSQSPFTTPGWTGTPNPGQFGLR